MDLRTINVNSIGYTLRDYTYNDEVQNLVKSIRVLGLRTPLAVVIRNGEYRLIDGYHRLMAAKEVGLAFVPVKVIEARVYDVLLEPIVASRQHVPTSPEQQLIMLKRLSKACGQSMTRERLAMKLNRSVEWVNTILGEETKQDNVIL